MHNQDGEASLAQIKGVCKKSAYSWWIGCQEFRHTQPLQQSSQILQLCSIFVAHFHCSEAD